MAAAAITGGEDAGDIGRVFVELGFGVGAGVFVDFEGIEEAGFRTEEAHGEEDQLGGNGFFGTGDFLRDEASLVVLFPADLDSEGGFDPSVFVGDEFFNGGEVSAGVVAEARFGFFLAVVDLEHLGPFGPGVILGAFLGRLGQDFELGERAAAVSEGGSDAVGSGISAADDEDIEVFGVDWWGAVFAVQDPLGIGGEELHGEVDALELTAGDRQVAGHGGTGAEDGGVELRLEVFGGQVFADLGIGDELDTFLLEEVDSAFDDLLFVEFHVRDAVHEQSSDPVGSFVDCDLVACLVELGSGGEAGGAGADDGDLFARAFGWRVRSDPAFVPATVHDGALDLFDGDWGAVESDRAGAFARGRADAAGELREVVGFVEAIEGFAPESPVDEVIPFGDEVIDWAAGGHAADEGSGVAEGYATIHAACCLLAEVFFGQVAVELIPVADSFKSWTIQRKFAHVF
ncbi:MAG: hypothetical protein RI897_3661 [Verrucomicrobiota bacterium]